MCAQRTALLRITHGSPSRREARTPTAPAGHLLAAPRWCAACGHGIAAEKGNSLVRHARTAHRAAAHYAWLTLKEGGNNSHRRGFAAPPLGGTKGVCRLRYFARSARAPLRRNSFASKTFSSCRTQIAADKGNSLVRHARTAHRAAAHYACLTLAQGGQELPPSPWLPL